jgi:heme/copper-type cytochrome/quinol oxidase subunit 2
MRLPAPNFAGLGHYKMHGVVHVVSQEDFDKWLAAREAEKQ